MALIGSAITLFVFYSIERKPDAVHVQDSSHAGSSQAKAFLTSFQLAEGQVDFTFAAEQTVHAVVHVTTKMKIQQPENPFEYFFGDRYNFRPREREVAGYGSGVIISPDGFIITNNHVIEDADNIEVKLNDNRVFKAELIGRDPGTDIALLRIKAENLSWLKYGNSDDLRIGEWVLAVGNPFNLTSTVTAGIISAKGRNLPLINSDYSIESYIQTDAALNPGNSGGALVDTKGFLVGITSAIISPSGSYAGYSFAIPVNIVRKVVDDIREFGTVQRAIMGIKMTVVSPGDAEAQDLAEVKGVLVADIIEGGAADAADLREKDIITKVDGTSINSPSELQEQIGKRRPGDRITVTYFRNGKENTAQLTLRNISGSTGIVEPGMGIEEACGARLQSLEQAEKKSMNIDNGVKIIETGDGIFKEMGLRKGTVITSVNGRKVNSAGDVRQATSGNDKNLKSIEGVTPDGRVFSYRFGY